MRVLFIALVLFMGPLFAQERPSTTENPLTKLKDEVKRVLADARLPFTEEQEDAIVLMMEDRRQASEEMFGQMMDFRSGPTQGQQMDRALAAIEWMGDEFMKRLRDYLTPEQLAVWNRFEKGAALTESHVEEMGGRTRRPQSQQTQYVRINNNAFTSEDPNYRLGRGGGGQSGTEVIQRGGTGAFHGNAQLLLKDETLNARNPFAHNRPLYQERQANFDFSGPFIPGRLTASFAANDSKAENVDTIHATLPDRVFDLGITRPTINRGISTRGTYQLTGAHSLTYNVRYGMNSSKNQNIGGFTMPERASTSAGNTWNLELRQFSALSPQTIFETRFNLSGNHDETTPVSNDVKIDVLDAFRIGGAQNLSNNTARNYNFGSLLTRLGEKLTLKTGVEGVYRTDRSFSENSFGGAFVFSSLGAYLEGRPLNYRVNRGDPLVQTNQLEVAFFLQNDLKLTPRFTFMYGARYDMQTNLSDHNNLAPRLGVAYAVSRATVIRGGVGVFYNRLNQNIVETQRRLDGTRQYEIVIDNPSFPDPFQSGTARNTLPSLRVTDPNLMAPYNIVTMVSFERTFFSNLFFSASYDRNREVHRFRYRNLNAPFPFCVSVLSTSAAAEDVNRCRPDSGRVNVLNLESTGAEVAQNFRMNFRERFSIFNVTANYTLARTYADSTPGSLDIPSNNYNLREDWSPAPFPLHTLSGTVNAQLPLGIFLTGSVSTNSGRAYNITTGKDDNRDTQVNDRPPGLPRNSGDGPKFLSFNFNISKAFFFGVPSSGSGIGGSRTNLNLFANMTNAFNHTNYGLPSGVMTSPNFGKSTSAMDPREIEVGLRFQF